MLVGLTAGEGGFSSPTGILDSESACESSTMRIMPPPAKVVLSKCCANHGGPGKRSILNLQFASVTTCEQRLVV